MSPQTGDANRGFDCEIAGRRAECDGGGLMPGTHYVAREEFTGTLNTGLHRIELLVDNGDIILD